MKCVVALVVVDKIQEHVHAPAPNVASLQEWLKWLMVWGTHAHVQVAEVETHEWDDAETIAKRVFDSWERGEVVP